MYASAAMTCKGSLESSGPAAFCFAAAQGEPADLLEYFTMACGMPPPEDAGAEDGGVASDAGAPESEDADDGEVSDSAIGDGGLDGGGDAP